ncbi:Hydrolase-like protein family [Striga hermonthica]|uniref:Hydrolase-like protein family n=1 Tax=Striga hermonthica TaxID=68872 RepID=A0A9N7R9L3_STRHE|nr:Hydrolase-like protein family [Striga hermonthica]
MVLFSSTLYYSCSLRNPRHRNHSNTTPSPSNPCSPSPYSSHPNSSYGHRPGRNWDFITFSGNNHSLPHDFRFPVFGIRSIWKQQSFGARATTITEGNFSSPRAMAKDELKPDHLLVLVHGIMGSPSDWTYFEAELKRQLGRSFLIYASSCNTYTKTLSGIDGAGKRLADEVTEVVKKTESLKKISFLAHSLGGLISRYAVGVLYTPNIDQPYYITTSTSTNSEKSCSSVNGLIAGLEAINFITLATPHLGVRGNKQLPFLLGMTFLEKLAVPVATIFAGRTGRQLFLTDGDPEKPPLLLRMASDCEDGKFISALGAFKHRFLYANVSYDHMVGWRTSSIRRERELAKPPSQSLDGYEHIVNVEYCPPVLTESPDFSPEAAKAKEAAQNEPNTKNTTEYHEIMEEEMIDGLQRLGWVKADVSFHSAFWPFLAHHNIHVKVKNCKL